MEDIRPILYSTPMVQSVLSGTKTQTRRIIKSRHESGMFGVETAKFEPDFAGYYHNRIVQEIDEDERSTGRTIFCPYGDIGTVLWVRETFCPIMPAMMSGDEIPDWHYYIYKATNELPLEYKWRPSIFMPKEACRIFLKVTDVRIERLQDISKIDCIAEGITQVDNSPMLYNNYLFNNKLAAWDGYGSITKTYGFSNPKDSYRSLWEKINGADSWANNNFVWVVSFERCNKPENFLN